MVPSISLEKFRSFKVYRFKKVTFSHITIYLLNPYQGHLHFRSVSFHSMFRFQSFLTKEQSKHMLNVDRHSTAYLLTRFRGMRLAGLWTDPRVLAAAQGRGEKGPAGVRWLRQRAAARGSHEAGIRGRAASGPAGTASQMRRGCDSGTNQMLRVITG